MLVRERERERKLPVNCDTIIPMIMNINKHCITFMNINGRSWKLIINNQHTLGLAQPREVLLCQLQLDIGDQHST